MTMPKMQVRISVTGFSKTGVKEVRRPYRFRGNNAGLVAAFASSQLMAWTIRVIFSIFS